MVFWVFIFIVLHVYYVLPMFGLQFTGLGGDSALDFFLHDCICRLKCSTRCLYIPLEYLYSLCLLRLYPLCDLQLPQYTLRSRVHLRDLGFGPVLGMKQALVLAL